MDHPNVVKVYDVDEHDDRLYLAMQWVDGQDLRSIIDRTGRLAPERASLSLARSRAHSTPFMALPGSFTAM